MNYSVVATFNLVLYFGASSICDVEEGDFISIKWKSHIAAFLNILILSQVKLIKTVIQV